MGLATFLRLRFGSLASVKRKDSIAGTAFSPAYLVLRLVGTGDLTIVAGVSGRPHLSSPYGPWRTPSEPQIHVRMLSRGREMEAGSKGLVYKLLYLLWRVSRVVRAQNDRLLVIFPLGQLGRCHLENLLHTFTSVFRVLCNPLPYLAMLRLCHDTFANDVLLLFIGPMLQ